MVGTFGIFGTSPGPAGWCNQQIGTKLVLPGFGVTSKMVIFCNIVLIVTGKPNKLQNIHNYLKKAENVFFLQIVVHFL